MSESSESSMWSTQSDGSYSEKEFYVRSTNQHDHSESIRIRLPKEVLAQASEMVSSKKYNAYRTVADVVRDALVHRLHHLAEESGDEDLMDFVNRQMMQARLDQRIIMLEEMDSICKTAEALLSEAAAKRHIDVLRETILDAYMMCEELPEPYASRMRYLAERYDAVLREEHGASAVKPAAVEAPKPAKSSFFRRG